MPLPSPILALSSPARPPTGAACALIAKALRVPARQVSLVAGASARIKRVQVAGAPAALAIALENLCAGGSPPN